MGWGGEYAQTSSKANLMGAIPQLGFTLRWWMSLIYFKLTNANQRILQLKHGDYRALASSCFSESHKKQNSDSVMSICLPDDIHRDLWSSGLAGVAKGTERVGAKVWK